MEQFLAMGEDPQKFNIPQPCCLKKERERVRLRSRLCYDEAILPEKNSPTLRVFNRKASEWSSIKIPSCFNALVAAR